MNISPEHDEPDRPRPSVPDTSYLTRGGSIAGGASSVPGPGSVFPPGMRPSPAVPQAKQPEPKKPAKPSTTADATTGPSSDPGPDHTPYVPQSYPADHPMTLFRQQNGMEAPITPDPTPRRTADHTPKYATTDPRRDALRRGRKTQRENRARARREARIAEIAERRELNRAEKEAAATRKYDEQLRKWTNSVTGGPEILIHTEDGNRRMVLNLDHPMYGLDDPEPDEQTPSVASPSPQSPHSRFDSPYDGRTHTADGPSHDTDIPDFRSEEGRARVRDLLTRPDIGPENDYPTPAVEQLWLATDPKATALAVRVIEINDPRNTLDPSRNGPLITWQNCDPDSLKYSSQRSRITTTNFLKRYRYSGQNYR